ncbi:hypothetical protein ABENE_04150 [Asticcacaulis benevestitus DSM 16100 = ATCC BAA-896]|uniref:Uncharacterized protein n=1 Tax=Asticcacaulis benevestitus DSM 16100 = ATCC BAA-896 TaxID=1121022 RepID=V4Q7R0_9CAUL|nr:hypothetical protein ABENE_04150 [Asticcacaulis benevestitus DSM 16100 = ATCC BAA-896]
MVIIGITHAIILLPALMLVLLSQTKVLDFAGGAVVNIKWLTLLALSPMLGCVAEVWRRLSRKR